MKAKFIFLSLFFTFYFGFAGESSGSFTQADREKLYKIEDRLQKLEERLFKLEVRMEENMKTIDARFELIDKRFDAMQNQMIGLQNQINNLFYLVVALLAAILGSFGYSVWDRLKANVPIKESIEEVKAKNIRLTNLLKDFAEKNTEFKTIFDRAAIL